MSKGTTIRWEKLKTEYVTGGISLKNLAEKHGMNVGTVRMRAREDGWVKQRNEYREKVSQRAIRRAMKKDTKDLQGILEASTLIQQKLLEAVNDPEQFNRYLVTYGTGEGKFGTEEATFQKLDMRAIREMTQALKTVESIIRSIGNIPTEAEAQRLELERKKFELEKEKWEKEKADASQAHEVRVVFDTDDLEGWTE